MNACKKEKQVRQKEKYHSRVCCTFVPTFDSFEKRIKQFITFIINLNTVIMRIFTKHFLAAALLCLAGVVQAGESIVKSIDFSVTDPHYYFDQNWIPAGSTQSVVSGEGLTLTNVVEKANPHEYQIFCLDNFNFSNANKYKVKINYKSTVAGNVQLTFGTWGVNYATTIAIQQTESFVDVISNEIAPTGSTSGNDAHVLFQCGKLVGTIVIKKVDVIEIAPDDPTLIPKAELTNAINIAKEVQSKYYTSQSFSAYTAAIATAQSALTAAGATAESLNGAKSALSEAYNNLELNPGYHNLTKDMFKNHTAQGVDGNPTGCAYDILKPVGMPYGDGNVWWLNYADLSAYDKLIVTVASGASGTPRFCMNRTENGAQDSGDPATAKFIDIPNKQWGTEAYYSKDGDKTFIIDLKKMVAERGIAYIHSMKSVGGNVIVTGMYLFDEQEASDYRPETAVGTGDIEINDTDPAIVAAKVALLSAITRAQSDEVRANKTKASLAALDEAINAGLAQLTAKPITVTEKVKKEVETKKELTFKTDDWCAAKWIAADKAFQWGQGGWNPAFTFMTAVDIKGDVTEWQKLHLKATNFVNSKENKLLVKFKEDDGKWPPSGPETDFIVETDAEGNIDIDLTAADIDWKTDRTKLADLTIYGQERESTETYGQVTVSEAWLSKTEEKEVEETTTMTPDVTVASLKAAATEIRMAVNELVDRAPVAELEVPAGWRSVINNGTLEGDDLSCFFSKDNSSDPYKSVTVDYEGIDDHKAIVLQTGGSKAATDWEDQFFIRATEILPAGKKFRVEFDYRSDINASGDSQCHEQPGNYIHFTCIGSPSFKSDWQHYTFEGTVPNECDGKMNNDNTYLKNFQTIAFNLSKTRQDVKFVFDNIQFLVEDPVTVIKGVETVAGKDEYYDLQGRRVAQPGKGLYIKNGKKVAIK